MAKEFTFSIYSLENEKNYLTSRIIRLKDFLSSYERGDVPFEKLKSSPQLLRKQLSAMEEYKAVLEERIRVAKLDSI